ncbi:MAG: hypothetical protein ACKVOR_02465 [Flavobacteriales bacterium]
MNDLPSAIHSEADLSAAIATLKTRQSMERKLVQESFVVAYESIQPINIIKDTLKRAMSSPEINGALLNKSVGFAAGYVSKKLVEGATANPLRKMLGAAVMMGVSNLINRNPQMVEALRKGFTQFFTKQAEAEEHV